MRLRHIEVIETPTAAGADVHAPASGWAGRTALQVAAEKGHLHIVKRLLASNADVNVSRAQTSF